MLRLHDPDPRERAAAGSSPWPRRQLRDVWIFVIGGFLQPDSVPHGVFRLWDKLNSWLARIRPKKPGVRYHVELCEWNANWSKVAERVAQAARSSGGRAAIDINGFSFGGGWGAIRLARELEQRGLRVNRMNLSDPVYRHPWFIFRWLSLFRTARIRVPRNVHQVWSFVQRDSLPSGHRLVAEPKALTCIHPAKLVEGVTHVQMDDLEAWHEQALANAELA